MIVDRTMFNRFLRLADSAPGATAVIETDSHRVVTRAALLARADELARELLASGVKSRDLVAVQLPNSAEFVAAILAASKLDLVVIPIDRDAPSTEVAAILGHFAVSSLIYRGAGSPTRRVGSSSKLPRDAPLIKLTSGP